MFDEPPSYSGQWPGLSFDTKQFIAYQIGTMVLVPASHALTVGAELGLLAATVATMIFLSVRHRRAADWHWSGVDAKGIVGAIWSVVVGAIFLFVLWGSTPLAWLTVLPFLLGMVSYGILTSLRIVRITEVDFASDCAPPSARATVASAAPPSPLWKRVVRGAHALVFMLVWLDGVAWFYFSDKSIRNGFRSPSGLHIEPMTEHGQIFYITPDQKHLNDLLEMAFSVGVPLVVATALALHYLLGVRLFPTRNPR